MDFFPVMSSVVGKGEDLIVLSGVALADAPLLVKTARELDFKGTLSTETAQDIKILDEVAGGAAKGVFFVWVGRAQGGWRSGKGKLGQGGKKGVRGWGQEGAGKGE